MMRLCRIGGAMLVWVVAMAGAHESLAQPSPEMAIDEALVSTLQARVADIAEQRARHNPTVPSALSLEKATNPFLRADDAALQRAIGMEGSDPAEVFAEIRSRKDRF